MPLLYTKILYEPEQHFWSVFWVNFVLPAVKVCPFTPIAWFLRELRCVNFFICSCQQFCQIVESTTWDSKSFCAVFIYHPSHLKETPLKFSSSHNSLCNVFWCAQPQTADQEILYNLKLFLSNSSLGTTRQMVSLWFISSSLIDMFTTRNYLPLYGASSRALQYKLTMQTRSHHKRQTCWWIQTVRR